MSSIRGYVISLVAHVLSNVIADPNWVASRYWQCVGGRGDSIQVCACQLSLQSIALILAPSTLFMLLLQTRWEVKAQLSTCASTCLRNEAVYLYLLRSENTVERMMQVAPHGLRPSLVNPRGGGARQMYGYVDRSLISSVGRGLVRSCGPVLVIVIVWSCGRVLVWSCGHVVVWSCGCVVVWS